MEKIWFRVWAQIGGDPPDMLLEAYDADNACAVAAARGLRGESFRAQPLTAAEIRHQTRLHLKASALEPLGATEIEKWLRGVGETILAEKKKPRRTWDTPDELEAGCDRRHCPFCFAHECGAVDTRAADDCIGHQDAARRARLPQPPR